MYEPHELMVGGWRVGAAGAALLPASASLGGHRQVRRRGVHVEPLDSVFAEEPLDARFKAGAARQLARYELAERGLGLEPSHVIEPKKSP